MWPLTSQPGWSPLRGVLGCRWTECYAPLFLLLFLGSALLPGCSAAAATPTPSQAVAPLTLTPIPVTLPPEQSPTAQQPTQQPKKGGVADHELGPDNAYLTITMYGDFQCAPCIDVARSLAVLRGRYPDDVRVVWRHFPQKENDKARLAAQASEAAGAQGKFWEMHDQLLSLSRNGSACRPLSSAPNSVITAS
jgi:protein-disulfide isomerase